MILTIGDPRIEAVSPLSDSGAAAKSIEAGATDSASLREGQFDGICGAAVSSSVTLSSDVTSAR